MTSTSTFLRRALVLGVLSSSAIGCATEESGPTPGTFFPWTWGRNQQELIVGFDVHTLDPSDLSGNFCQLYVQAARSDVASEIGGVGVGDADGYCRRFSSAPEEDFRVSPWEPLCAGTVAVTQGDSVTNFTVCDDAVPAPAEFTCGGSGLQIAGTTIGVATLADEELAEDEVGEASVTIESVERPTIMSPEPFGDGMVIWPEGDLRIGWGGSGGEAIEIRLAPRREPSPTILCAVPDTGEFTIPREFLDEVADVAAVLEVSRVHEGATTVDGTRVRVVHRISDAVWITP